MSDKRGFTLIELAVVIFLLGAFFLVAIPRFKDIADVNIKSASRRLSSLIRLLYNEAAFKKKLYKLEFDVGNGEYWVEVQDGNEFVIPNDPILGRKKLPEGVYFKDITTQRSTGRTLERGDLFILFMPTGFVEPAVIHLEAESGANYTIATKPYTGGTIVIDEYVDLLHSR